MDDVCSAVQFAMDQLGVKELKDKQKEAIHNFVRGRDCFVILHGIRENVVLCLAAIRVRPSSNMNTSIFNCSLCIAIGISDD